jgi:ATP-binding cassette, subfamily B, multidrug efflux pump
VTTGEPGQASISGEGAEPTVSTATESGSRYPTTLGGQFRRHAPQYLTGALMLAAFQLAMNRIDWQSKTAIDDVFGETPSSAWKPASTMLLLALGAFFARVASRWYLFNAGRDAEY